MNERYSTLFKAQNNLYITGSPVIIAAGALLRDEQTGNILAQVKFQSITSKTIIAMYIDIRCKDISGTELQGVSNFKYLDLSIARNMEFGQKIPISLPDLTTRSFDVRVVKVVFSDGSIIELDDSAEWQSIEPQITLTEFFGDNKFAAQYIRETVQSAQYVEKEEKDIWFCTCGAINHQEEKSCHNCELELQYQISLLDKQKLLHHLQAFERAEAEKNAIEDAEQAEIKEQQRIKARKIKKQFTIIVTAVVVFAALILTLTLVIIPSNRYSKAMDLLENGQYDEASVLFDKLGKYKDSKYQTAVALLDAKKYGEAIAAFEEAGETAYTSEELRDAYRAEAETLLVAGDQVGAAKAFILAGDNFYPLKPEAINLSSYVSAGVSHCIGLRADGTVVAAGVNTRGQCNVSKWTSIIAVSAGFAHTVGLRADGTVVSTEGNVSDWTDIVSISAGCSFTVGLHSDGTVVATGENGSNQCNVSGWSNIIEVSAGYNHSVGLRADGTVIATGDNEYGQCNVSDWSDIVAIAAGTFHTVGLKKNGSVVATGLNYYGQCEVSNWSDITAVSAWVYTVGLASDGTVVVAGNYEYDECVVYWWKDIVAVSSKAYTIGIRGDGTAVSTGQNDYGKCDVSSWDLW